MIAHVSIPAQNPKHVAMLLGKIISGSVFKFPVVEGTFIVVANDNSGTAIEVYPAGMCHHPGSGDAPSVPVVATIQTQPWEDQIYPETDYRSISSHHMALTSTLSEQEVIDLGKKFGFRAVPCDRAGVFKLVEIWIDNTYLVEVLSPHESQRYKDFMNPAAASKMFGEPL